jgi:putative aldouronate transport system permease protein
MGSTAKARLSIVKKNADLYLLLIPGLAFIALFKYTPIFSGVAIALKDFNIFDGIAGSPWVGLANFRELFASADFMRVFKNTLIISCYRILFLFPLPILIAVLLNEVGSGIVKKTVQTVIYIPHFLSWIIIAGLFVNILSVSNGLVNNLIRALGGQPISFLTDNAWFRAIIVISAGWKEVGWNTIVYIAAIAAIDPELYEAALIDGAGRLRRVFSVTVPGMAATIVLMFILRIGDLLEAGTVQILILYNPLVYETGDVIGTYVYRVGLGQMDYSFSTAVGLFNSVVGFALVIGGNAISKKVLHRSIW